MLGPAWNVPAIRPFWGVDTPLLRPPSAPAGACQPPAPVRAARLRAAAVPTAGAGGPAGVRRGGEAAAAPALAGGVPQAGASDMAAGQVQNQPSLGHLENTSKHERPHLKAPPTR